MNRLGPLVGGVEFGGDVDGLTWRVSIGACGVGEWVKGTFLYAGWRVFFLRENAGWSLGG